jgi:hypothetical protein
VLDDRGSIPGRRREGKGIYSLRHRVQTGSGAHPVSYPMDTGGLSPRVKWPGREADSLPPSSAKVKNAWSYTSTPQYIFVAWYGKLCLSQQQDR